MAFPAFYFVALYVNKLSFTNNPHSFKSSLPKQYKFICIYIPTQLPFLFLNRVHVNLVYLCHHIFIYKYTVHKHSILFSPLDYKSLSFIQVYCNGI